MCTYTHVRGKNEAGGCCCLLAHRQCSLYSYAVWCQTPRQRSNYTFCTNRKMEIFIDVGFYICFLHIYHVVIFFIYVNGNVEINSYGVYAQNVGVLNERSPSINLCDATGSLGLVLYCCSFVHSMYA